jgi:hypothetical protein
MKNKTLLVIPIENPNCFSTKVIPDEKLSKEYKDMLNKISKAFIKNVKLIKEGNKVINQILLNNQKYLILKNNAHPMDKLELPPNFLKGLTPLADYEIRRALLYYDINR